MTEISQLLDQARRKGLDLTIGSDGALQFAGMDYAPDLAEQLVNRAGEVRSFLCPEPEADDLEHTITNYRMERAESRNGKVKEHPIPLPMKDVLASIRGATAGWPRSVGGSLFVHDAEHGIAWLSQPHDLFGWLQSRSGRVEWRTGEGMVKQSEAFAELRRTAQTYESIETLPHHPAIAGHFYANPELPESDGTALARLLDKFTPATDIDRDLLLAAIVTPAWGGPAGARPAFVITSDHGRGVGKSTYAKIIARVWGGDLSFSARDEIGSVKTRMLTPEARARRIALLDNVKSLRFSWAELEGLITADHISGHQLYAGESSRPNVLTWLITLNGASLSRDMSQRSVIIKLARASHSGTWEEATRRYVEYNRLAIIADALAVLRGDAHELPKYTRWGAWEKDVLQRLPEPAEAQAVILERQAEADAEGDEAAILIDYFAERLADLHYSPETDTVFIPSGLACRWLNEATNDKLRVQPASRILGQLVDEGMIPQLQRNKDNKKGRGFVWAGEHADLDDPIKCDIKTRSSWANVT